jgi:hypothetical protein
MRKPVAIFIILVVVWWIVWLNRFHYEHITNGQIVRINRYTQQICYSWNDGTWSQYQSYVALGEATDALNPPVSQPTTDSGEGFTVTPLEKVRPAHIIQPPDHCKDSTKIK